MRFFFLAVCILTTAVLFAQQPITGKVSSGDAALVGATVQVKGRKIATSTDANGFFSINAPADATLVINSVGYQSIEVRVGSRSTV